MMHILSCVEINRPKILELDKVIISFPFLDGEKQKPDKYRIGKLFERDWLGIDGDMNKIRVKGKEEGNIS